MPIPDVTTGAESGYSTSVVSIQNQNVGVASKPEDRDKREIDRLRSTCELYQSYCPLWDFFLAAYEGGKAMADVKNLFKHVREQPDDFNERAKRIYYHNYCFPLVDFFTTFIFTESIQREGGKNSEMFTEFITNVNRKGDDITSFMMTVSDEAQIFGMTYVLVDAPQKTEVALTKGDVKVAPETVADQNRAGLKPYWVSVRPTEVLDWVVDEFDKYLYLKRVQHQTRMNGMTKQLIERYTEWTPTEIKISEIDVTVADKPVLLPGTGSVITNELQKVPFVVARYKRCKTDKFMGLSFLNDLAFINREVMNLTSLLQEFLYRQCFNILAMEQDTNVPEIDQLQGEISTANMLKYAPGTKAPTYISPPVQPAEFLQRERANNIMEMYKIAAQDTQNDLYNGVKSSGFSKAQSFQTTVPKIATRADMLASTEMALFKMTFEYVGKEWDGTIKYKDHYQITNLTDALNQLTTIFQKVQITSKTFVSEQMKRMVHEFDGRLSADQIKKIYAEIDATDWPDWFGIQQLALLGRAAIATEASGVVSNDTGDDSAPVLGKDTATAASTPQRAQSSSDEIAKESAKS